MKLLDFIPLPWRYITVALLGLTLSVVSVVLAVRDGCPEEGQRGGALATAIALFVVFSRPDYGMEFYEDRKAQIPTTLPLVDQLKRNIRLIEIVLATNSKGQTLQNYMLAIATFIGTIFWGFGDVFARWFIRGAFRCGG